MDLSKFKEIDFYFDYLERNIYSKRSLILFLLVIPSLLYFLLSLFRIKVSDLVWWIVLSIAELAWILFWFYFRSKYPKVDKGKVGIVLAINTEKELDRTKVYRDFVEHFKSLMAQHSMSGIFQLVELNEYQSTVASGLLAKHSEYLTQFRKDGHFDKKSRPQDWERVQNKIGGHFFIWGKIRKRLDKNSKYIFDIDGLVTHKRIDVNKHKLVTNDFIESWFKRIAFSEIFELKGFEVSAELVFLVVKYVIGVAALVSNDPILSLELHTGLKSELTQAISKFDKPPNNLLLIQKKLDALIAEENSLIATWYIRNNQPDQCDKYLLASFDAKQDNYAGYILQALRCFQKGDIKGSFSNVEKARKIAKNNQIWRYDLAFLQMWTKDYGASIRTYKKITDNDYAGEQITVDEIINFLTNLLKTNPEFKPAEYILGLLFYKKVNNLPFALEHFEKFKESIVNESEYNKLLSVTLSYLGEIKKEMGIS